MKLAPHIQSGAEFSPNRIWRYSLWRRWGWNGYPGQVMFIGLNPSTADETQNDPTVTRCINFAKAWGYSGMFMMNAYAFRATKPKNLWLGRQFDDSDVVTSDPIGPDNDTALCQRADQSGLIIAAWGAHCKPQREEYICGLINKPIHCLGRTKSGRPRHPLYLKADTQPELFWKPEN